MELNQLWHLLDTQLDKIKSQVAGPQHGILDQSFSELRNTLALFLEEQVSPALPHPHPRSRIYRAYPNTWKIMDVTADQVFEKILQQKKHAQKKPACVFDLDGTLFDVGYRTIGILNEWLTEHGSKIDPVLFKKLSKINYGHVGYSLVHVFENAGFNLRDELIMDLFTQIERVWKQKFFDGESLVQYDLVMKNSAQFVHQIKQQGIHVVYLTGRYASKMSQGTKTQLHKHGFPLDDCDVILKEDIHMEDQIFKAEQIKRISAGHDVIGNFENEYFNIAFMAMEAPCAVHVIVDSQHSGRLPPELNMPVCRVHHF